MHRPLERQSLAQTGCALALTGLACCAMALAHLACSGPREPVVPGEPAIPLEPTDRSASPLPRGCPALADLSQGLPVSPGWRTNPSLADVNGDGYLDLAATTRKGEGPKVFLYDPAGKWVDSSRGIGVDVYPCGIGVDLVDLTGDGRLDLLVADHCDGLFLFEGDGRGGWRRLAHLRHPAGEGFNDAAAGDLDGDGRIDLAALGAFTTGITLYRQQASGGFAPLSARLPRSGGGSQLRLADLDGDGRLDLYGTLQGINPPGRARGEREAKVWLQRPRGAWEPGAGLPESGNSYGLALGDFNEDGRPDLALSNMDYEGGVLLFEGTGPGAWRPLAGPPPGQAPGRLFAGVSLVDLDGDGHLDLVAVEHRKPAIVTWVGDGAGHFAECPPGGPPLAESLAPGWGVAAGDIDRDGHPDLVAGFGSEGGGALRAWALAPSE